MNNMTQRPREILDKCGLWYRGRNSSGNVGVYGMGINADAGSEVGFGFGLDGLGMPVKSGT